MFTKESCDLYAGCSGRVRQVYVTIPRDIDANDRNDKSTQVNPGQSGAEGQDDVRAIDRRTDSSLQ